MKSNFLFGFMFFSFSQIYCQIKSVSYDLRYNTISNQYDAYLIILDGEAHKVKERIQFNAQLSIVAPSNTSFSVEKSYMPLIANANYKGSKSITWEVTNYLEKVEAIDNNSIYSVAPKLTHTGFYNDLKTGDEVKLFSVELSPMPINKKVVRLYSNTDDAKSKALSGNNFSNGFTLGGVNQLYTEEETVGAVNSTIVKEFTSKVYPNPAMNHVNVDITSAKEEIVKIIIIDIKGREVLRNSFEKTTGLMTKYLAFNLAPGIYSMKIEIAGLSQVHKIVIAGQISTTTSSLFRGQLGLGFLCLCVMAFLYFKKRKKYS